MINPPTAHPAPRVRGKPRHREELDLPAEGFPWNAPRRAFSPFRRRLVYFLPAVKTGANLDVPRGSAGRLPAPDGRDGKMDGTVEEGAADDAVVASGAWALPPACSDASVDASGSENISSGSSSADEDECFLDLLDTLDEGDFDPALLL